MEKVLNVSAHVAYGCLSGYFWWIDSLASVFLFFLFVFYEVVERVKIRDELYHEVKEFTAGFALGLVIHHVVKTLGLSV